MNNRHPENSTKDYRDPYHIFADWYNHSVDPADPDGSVMYLATTGPELQPALRAVLFKGIEDGCFVFFTNYLSRKGEDIALNPRVALLFHWEGKQVRIEGEAVKVNPQLSDSYFNSRPLQSRINAIISHQSKAIKERKILEDEHKRILESVPENALNRPDYWGGYFVKPHRIEFWQAGEYRLHQRDLYQLHGEKWEHSILAP